MGSCSTNTEDMHKINKRVIEEVLKKSLTCPSLLSIANLDSARDVSIIGKENELELKNLNTISIKEELKDMYWQLILQFICRKACNDI